jgi:peptidoglycan-N-acetylglucosamine deacetylase
MTRHIACLTFDHDNTALFLARGMDTPTLMSRGEFGTVAIPRILDLLRRYEVPATFFTPGHTIETYPADVEAVVNAGHEIGHHGWTHRVPSTLGRDGEKEELVRGNEAIERLTGQRARGYRSPSWDLSEHSVDLLLEHGFAYDSSMMGHDYDCYFVRRGDRFTLESAGQPGEATALVEMPISWTLDDYPHFEYMRTSTGIQQGLMNTGQVLQNWVDDFVYMTRIQDFGILTYTFHPHVIGRGHRMMMLDRLITTLREHGAVFLTMEAALAEWRANRGGS